MLTRMLPDQITKNWDLIRHGVINGLPPSNGRLIGEDKLEKIATNVLDSVIRGEGDVWLIHQDEKIFAIVTTMLAMDAIAGETSLIIYSLYGYREMSMELFREGLKGIAEYGKSKGVNIISAFTDMSNVLNVARALGFKVSNFLTLEV